MGKMVAKRRRVSEEVTHRVQRKSQDRVVYILGWASGFLLGIWIHSVPHVLCGDTKCTHPLIPGITELSKRWAIYNQDITLQMHVLYTQRQRGLCWSLCLYDVVPLLYSRSHLRNQCRHIIRPTRHVYSIFDIRRMVDQLWRGGIEHDQYMLSH